MKNIDKKYFENPEQHIPYGIYCYDENGLCPFWDKYNNLLNESNVYCHYLKLDDNEDMGLLWDKCKECNVNNYYK